MRKIRNSENDFGNNIIPNLLSDDGRDMYAYHFSGYWKDVGTISSLWEANMEVLDPKNSGIDLFDDRLEDLQSQQWYDRSQDWQ